MTDAELIARLRMMPTYSGDPKGPHWLPNQAADRIEALIAERDAAEAKLAKAVEALRKISSRPYDKTWGEDTEVREAMRDMERVAHATLAEIKKPITEWPEETGNIMVGKLKGESHE